MNFSIAENETIGLTTFFSTYHNTKREGMKKIINTISIKIKMLIVTSTSFNGSNEIIAFINTSSDAIRIPITIINNVSKRKIFIIFSGLEFEDTSITFTTIGFNEYTNNNMARNINSITHIDEFAPKQKSTIEIMTSDITNITNNNPYAFSLFFLLDFLGKKLKSIYLEIQIPIIPKINEEFKKLIKYLTPINKLIEIISG